MADPQQKTQHETQTPDEIEAEIAETREELADTVAALTAKADVTGRAKSRAAEVRREHGTELAAAGAAVLVLTVALVWWRRR